MSKKVKTILYVAKFLLFCLLLTLEIGLSSLMTRIVFDCIKCFFAYPSIMSFLQLLLVLFEASIVGVFTFLTIIAITLISGQE
jgi:hypothetical protein